jgi:hypothetical protein
MHMYAFLFIIRIKKKHLKNLYIYLFIIKKIIYPTTGSNPNPNPS